MTDYATPLERITDDVDQLTRPQRTTERVDRLTQQVTGNWKKLRGRHIVHFPSLLEQLATAVHGSQMGGEDYYRGIPESKPSARLDAIACTQRIQRESLTWAHRLNTRARVPLDDRLRGLIGGATAHPELASSLAKRVRSWTVEARVVTRLESPAYTPNVQCPNENCERRGGLRIRLDSQIGACIECGQTWDGGAAIQSLAVYVRWATEHLAGPRHWLVDPEGFPIECVECLAVREAMADRQSARAAARRAQEELRRTSA